MKIRRFPEADWGSCPHDRPKIAKGLCRGCYLKRYRQLSPEAELLYQKIKAVNQRKRRLRKQGISLERYEEMLREQGARCAICREAPAPPDRGKPVKYIERLPLDVDHDHQTGKVRGLLCNRCNSRVLPIIELWRHLIEPALAYLRR